MMGQQKPKKPRAMINLPPHVADKKKKKTNQMQKGKGGGEGVVRAYACITG